MMKNRAFSARKEKNSHSQPEPEAGGKWRFIDKNMREIFYTVATAAKDLFHECNNEDEAAAAAAEELKNLL